MFVPAGEKRDFFFIEAIRLGYSGFCVRPTQHQTLSFPEHVSLGLGSQSSLSLSSLVVVTFGLLQTVISLFR